MAEKGLSIPQIKSITGHQSDSVVQEYISNTKSLRMNSGAALAFGDQPVSVLGRRPNPYMMEEQQFYRYNQQPIININLGNNSNVATVTPEKL